MSQILPFRAVNPDLRRYGPSLSGRILILEGLISAGKSTAGKEILAFAEKIGVKCKFFTEPLIQDLLDLFLSNQKKYAFSFQLAMLIKRQAIYREAQKFAAEGWFCIIDRSLYGDYCFALMHKNRGNISDEPETLDQSAMTEWKSYLAALHCEEFNHPDYVIYLEVTPETAIRRCKKRDRNGETKYTKEYFEELCQVYNSVIPSSPAKSIDVMDWNEEREVKDIARVLLDRVKKMYDHAFNI
jgi:deoxyadenosine/deoxycytidine kinase